MCVPVVHNRVIAQHFFSIGFATSFYCMAHTQVLCGGKIISHPAASHNSVRSFFYSCSCARAIIILFIQLPPFHLLHGLDEIVARRNLPAISFLFPQSLFVLPRFSLWSLSQIAFCAFASGQSGVSVNFYLKKVQPRWFDSGLSMYWSLEWPH